MDFFADLANVVHYFLWRNHVEQVLEPEVDICHALASFRIDECKQHFQEVIVLIDPDFGYGIFGNSFGLLQHIDDFLVSCIEK
ncbi:hypothetical protein D3C77_672890 [compost metagenome]